MGGSESKKWEWRDKSYEGSKQRTLGSENEANFTGGAWGGFFFSCALGPEDVRSEKQSHYYHQ